MLHQDVTTMLQEQVQQALATRSPLRISGSDSKAFYGLPTSANLLLDISGHCGIIDYEPSELVITVRAGTPLQELIRFLTEHGQMLAFEPPLFGSQATMGGTLACGFSGPRRPYAGSARDFVLGCRILNGHADVLQFGGRVMKNVAGFDISRLMVGALGQLGVILDISLRVLPLPEAEVTVNFSCLDANTALVQMQQWQAQPWPISALAWYDGLLWLRLSGAEAAIKAAAIDSGGTVNAEGDAFWAALREQQLDFFQGSENLWRISVAPATPTLDCAGKWLLDWGGAQRWLKSSEPAEIIHTQAALNGGHAVCFRGNADSDWLRLAPELLALHSQLRLAFDPHQLFNPHRFSASL